jgi:hypothetical protein
MRNEPISRPIAVTAGRDRSNAVTIRTIGAWHGSVPCHQATILRQSRTLVCLESVHDP